MKKLLSFIFLLVAVRVQAHPMGNFSINHYAAFSVEKEAVHIDYIIDMAEIPTFQEISAFDTNGDRKIDNGESAAFAHAKSREFQSNLSLFLNDRKIELRCESSSLRTMRGAGGLPTLVFRYRFSASWEETELKTKNKLEYSDRNFPERIGWKEIVINKSEPNLTIVTKGDFIDRSRELSLYPQDPTVSPPQETEVSFSFSHPAVRLPDETETTTFSNDRIAGALLSVPAGTNGSVIQTDIPGSKPEVRPKNDPSSNGKKGEDRFALLVSTHELTGEVLFFSLLIAFALGAMHALSPGHGKTIVAGYLVGSRGTAYHAIFLGIVVTLTHTTGVFALGLVTLYGSRYILPERLYPLLSLFSGISIVAIGLLLFRKRYHLLHSNGHAHHACEHQPKIQDHHHDQDSQEAQHHHESHTHSHFPLDHKTGSVTWKGLLTIGVSGGALPCPSALVVLLSAISLHRIGFGLFLIVAFSLGLAVVLTGIGILLVLASRLSARLPFSDCQLQRIPLASSLIVTILGLAIAIQALQASF